MNQKDQAISAIGKDEEYMHDELNNPEQLHEQHGDEHELDEASLPQLRDMANGALMLQANASLHLLNTIQAELKHRIEEAGSDPETESDPELIGLSEDMKEWIRVALQAKQEEAERIAEEKAHNYQEKLRLISELDLLTRSDETEESIAQVREIQKQWKQIRVLPQDKVQELWDQYHQLLDLFYDNHSINIELKELDRKKNLEAKIELTMKVEELLKEDSIKKSFNLLNKYHDEFKHIGPIPKESREAIWTAFKAASDMVYKQKKATLDQLNEKLKENLDLKVVLVEKASLIAKLSYDSTKVWNEKTREMDALFKEWKQIGPVSRSKSDEIWRAFRNERNLFYAKRKSFFLELNKGRQGNLELKQALCEQVEALKDSTDFADTTKKIIRLQKEWKSIGPVPDRHNQAIWKRFRSACDAFFKQKDAHFADQHKEETANLKIKSEILEQLKTMLDQEDDANKTFDQLKEISVRWREAGHVPKKDYKRISSTYDQLSEQLFQKFNKSKADLAASEWESHYTRIGQTPNGYKRLQDDEFKLKKRLNGIQADLLTIETNLGFFAKSANASKLLKDFEKKKDHLSDQITRIRDEVKVIQRIKRTLQG